MCIVTDELYNEVYILHFGYTRDPFPRNVIRKPSPSQHKMKLRIEKTIKVARRGVHKPHGSFTTLSIQYESTSEQAMQYTDKRQKTRHTALCPHSCLHILNLSGSFSQW
ncbi:hypothetical protein E2C01_056399 [Portunus trituberculatus]|uniref:Uncharacterized protein n=1 Tax=Portunus trituberculatus TaxID=210409 RepID=A0A5B7GY28_PORTR|nr:hypothetical protein [Portunus trituberculatus]